MTARPIITGLEITEFTYVLEEFGRDYNGFNLIYEPGGKVTMKGAVLRV
ncbi:MAG: mandelate racemase, partial [Chloroflexi bacterium]|nr:mandelate racemase [Chloroflexota bacterium]